MYTILQIIRQTSDDALCSRTLDLLHALDYCIVNGWRVDVGGEKGQ